MNSLLIITSYGLGESVMAANRLRRLIASLIQQGCDVYCLCPRLGSEKLPPDPHLHILSLPFITTGQGFLSKMGRKLLFPIVGTVWASQKVLSKGISQIVCTIPEIEAFMIGVGVKKLLGSRISLVLEVRDPFSVNLTYPWNFRKRWYYHRLEAWLLRCPDKAIFLTSEIEQMYLSNFESAAKWRLERRVITNGYDRRDFEGSALRTPQNRLKLAYVGNFYGSRHPLMFLRVLEQFLSQTTEPMPIEIVFAGTIYGHSLRETIRQICEQPPLKEHVRWMGGLAYAEALRLMQEADINFLITHESGSEYAIPGKIFEYMGAGKPVLALTKDPLVIRLVQETRLGWVCRDEEELLSWFSGYLRAPEKVKAYRQDSELIKPYELRNLHAKWLELVKGAS